MFVRGLWQESPYDNNLLDGGGGGGGGGWGGGYCLGGFCPVPICEKSSSKLK